VGLRRSRGVLVDGRASKGDLILGKYRLLHRFFLSSKKFQKRPYSSFDLCRNSGVTSSSSIRFFMCLPPWLNYHEDSQTAWPQITDSGQTVLALVDLAIFWKKQ
jgi:hypothetical protein